MIELRKTIPIYFFNVTFKRINRRLENEHVVEESVFVEKFGRELPQRMWQKKKDIKNPQI